MSGMAPTHDLQLKWKRGPQPLDVNSARLRQRTRGIDQSLRALTPLGAPIAEFVSGVNQGLWGIGIATTVLFDAGCRTPIGNADVVRDARTVASSELPETVC